MKITMKINMIIGKKYKMLRKENYFMKNCGLNNDLI